MRVGWAAGVACLLVACATVPLAPIDRSASGRFALTAVRDGELHSLSGRFNLEVRGKQQIFDLSTPVGTTLARIEVEPERARASGPQFAAVEGPDPDALAEQLFGWRLPVAGLADWIDGRPNPQRPAKTEMSDGQIATIMQDGWTIQIVDRFQPSAKPKRLVVDRPQAGTQPAVTVRLIIDDPNP